MSGAYGSPFYVDRWDYRDDFGVFIDTVAGIDISTGQAFWRLTAIDPRTGEIPLDPLMGFLPPNLDRIEGQGFLTYSIRPKTNAPTGTVIDAEARIVFDNNEPIDTPPIFNTLDAGVPTSDVALLPELFDEPIFLVQWSGQDDENGSGLASNTIYVSMDERPFTPWLTDTTLTEALFVGEPGRRYAFYSTARDNVGNVEAAPLIPDTRTRITGGLATIGNRVWLDANANGIQDDGESGVEGITVRLFTTTVSDPIAVMTTDAQGFYSFPDFSIHESYFLEFVAPVGFAFTRQAAGANEDLDNDVDIDTGRTSVFTLTLGLNNQWDAGLVELGSLSGIVWRDMNGDGARGANELLLADQVIYLDLNNNSQFDADEPSQTTDTQGSYTFAGVRPGQHVVRQVIPDGWEQTFPGITGSSSIRFAGSSIELQSPSLESFVGLNRQSLPLHSDVNGDGITSPLDVVIIINALHREDQSNSTELGSFSIASFDHRDVNRDGVVDQTDVRQLIDWIENQGSLQIFAGGSGSGSGNDSAHQLIGLTDLRADDRFADLDGRGLAVVVIDTGLDLDHPFFGTSTAGRADRIVYSYDFADQDADIRDYSGHGTHVTSIIASEDADYPGVAPGVDIIHLKVFRDNGQGTFAYLERALQWVAMNAEAYGIAAVNMSLGDGANWTQIVSRHGIGDELALLDSFGVITVAAAGNSFALHDSRQGLAYPAADAHTISVGAVWDMDRGFQSAGAFGIDYTTDADRVTSFSQRHEETLDILAPGALITAGYLGGGVATMRGTSMSAPFVTGAAVLMQQLSLEHYGVRLTNAQFRELLISSSETVVDGDDEDDNVLNTGASFGRLNIQQLAELLLSAELPSDDGGGDSDGSSDDPGDLGSSGGSYGYTVDLVSGEAREDLDFGMRPIDITAPFVEELRFGDGTAQRSMIRSVEYLFDSEVVFQDGAFILSRGDDTIPLIVEHLVENDRSRVLLTFDASEHRETSGSLVDGRYTLRALETHITDLAGNTLDGDGDGVPGADRVDEFFRFFGDNDGNAKIDLVDFNAFRSAYSRNQNELGYNAAFDNNHDGVIGLADFSAFRRNFGRELD